MFSRKITLFFILLFLFSKIFAGVSTASSSEDHNMISESRKSIVKITSINNNIEQVGTGFIVGITENKSLIVTITHVVEGDPNPKVEFFDKKGDKFESELIYAEERNPNKGLAILVVKSAEIPKNILPLQLPPEETTIENFFIDLDKRDATMFTFGFPQGGADWAYEELTYSAKKGRDLLFSGNIHSGNSGSPVIKKGRIIGIITETGQFVHATSALAIRELLSDSSILPLTKNEIDKDKSVEINNSEKRLLKNLVKSVNNLIGLKNEVIGIITVTIRKFLNDNRFENSISKIKQKDLIKDIIYLEKDVVELEKKVKIIEIEDEQESSPENVLIFNACKLKTAHEILAKSMRVQFPTITVDAQFNWRSRYEMEKTKIYFLSSDYQIFANRLEKWFEGEQEVIDYHNQSRIVGINEERNIVIFLGNDYKKVLSTDTEF